MAMEEEAIVAEALLAERTLLEFKAGKMVLEDNRVIADPRKGWFRIIKAPDGLVHVQWMLRDSDDVEEDHIVFPDEAVFEKVQQTSQRVYILKFNSDNRKLFFWLQESSSDGDFDLCNSVNYHLNNPDPQYVLEPEHIGHVPTPASATSDQQAVQLSDLQRILSNLGQGSNGLEGPSMFRDPGPSLSDVLKPDNVLPLIENSHLGERLSAYLPEGNWTSEAIVELMQSPQFRQQIDMFTHALRTGQMDLSQFGIDSSQYDFTVVSFLEAIEKQVASEASDRSNRDVDNMDE